MTQKINMIKEAINLLVEKNDLPPSIMRNAMEQIMKGEVSEAEISSFLTALRMKKETIDEITQAAIVMRKHMIKISPHVEKLIDTCGTGGDGSHTFNISTLVAFVLASAGLSVAKHGNRSVSSSCGSADLLESFGIPLNLEPKIIQEAIEKINFGFLFAPLFHPAMKYATPVRRKISIRTIFNVLGPLCNPAEPKYQLLGVYNKDLIEPIANVLKNLGLKRALVVHSKDGLDEVSLSDVTFACFLNNDKIEKLEIDPKKYGFKFYDIELFKVEDLNQSYQKVMDVFKGEDSPELDIVCLNSGWALFVAEVVSDVEEGIEKAREVIKEGKVYEKLKEFKNFCQNAFKNN
jgi:anthranilate phosphoribosyltransferase